jgi:hypothetical protein
MSCLKISVEKPDGKRLLRRPRRSCVDKIKMDLNEIGWDSKDWIDLALEDSCGGVNGLSGSIKCW